jgi:hypothetical protein
MANPNNTIENVLDRVALPDNGTERLRAFYEDRQELWAATEVNLQDLRESIDALYSLDAKIVALIVQISWLDVAKSTPAWARLSDDEKHLFGDVHSHEGHNHGDVPNPPTPWIAGPSPLPEDFVGPAGIEVVHEDEVTTLRREIDNMLKQGEIGNVPGSAVLIKSYEEKLKDPGLNAAHLTTIRDSLNKLQAAVSGFEATKAQDIIDRIQNYTDSRETKTNEGNMLIYGAIVHDVYKLGYRLSFGRGGQVSVSGGSEPGGAERLQSSFNGKSYVVDWLKRGLVINTSHWTDFMNSYPSESTATVEKYISTFYKWDFTANNYDSDLLGSADAGWFDIQGPDGAWVSRGMNVYSVATAAQQAAKKWKEMGYQSPLQKSNPKTMKFAEFAYGVAKYGFAAASVWKGTKALWKTIFGDEAGMKAAWWDFGKTLAWTGAVWYGVDVVRTVANDIKSEMDLPDYVQSIQSLDAEEGKHGMYDGFEAIWKKVWGGIMPGMLSTAGVLEAFMPSTVPAHQFKEMWEILISGRKGTEFLNANISTLSKALNNQYHTKNGSHVGGIREFFYDMGSTGKDIYDKFFIGRSTGDDARTFLRAIADYRSEESFPGANDQIGDRNQSISTLFATPLTKKEVTPANVDPEMEEFKKAAKKLGYTITGTVISGSTLVLEALDSAGRTVKYNIENAAEFFKEFDPKDWPKLMTLMETLGAVGLAAGGIWALSLIPGTGMVIGTLKWVGMTGIATVLGMFLWDKVKGNIDTPEKLLESIKERVPILRAPIEALESAGYTGKALLEQIRDMSGTPPWVKEAIDAILTPSPSVTPDVPPVEPNSVPDPVPDVEISEQYKQKIKDVATQFKDKMDVVDVDIGQSKYVTKKALSTAILANYTPYGAWIDFSKSDFKFIPNPPTDTDLLALYNVLR